jgi:hypothetical protein
MIVEISRRLDPTLILSISGAVLIVGARPDLKTAAALVMTREVSVFCLA